MIYGIKRPLEGVVSVVGIALVLGAGACAGESNDPSGISSGGTSAGRGGGTSTAGRGGEAAGGGAGSAMVDAGSGAGAGGAAGSSMGGASMGGSGGTSTRPPGCPEPNPIPAAGQTIVIQSLNIDTAQIVLKNASSTTQRITLGRTGWQWCEFPRYWSLTEQDSVLDLAPGETFSFFAINNQSGQPQLVPEEGEMAIYNRIQAFDDYQAMEAFVAWGDIQAYRESYAVQRGVWTFDERIEIAPGHAGFIATGDVNRASGYTSAPARCLVQ